MYTGVYRVLAYRGWVLCPCLLCGAACDCLPACKVRSVGHARKHIHNGESLDSAIVSHWRRTPSTDASAGPNIHVLAAWHRGASRHWWVPRRTCRASSNGKLLSQWHEWVTVECRSLTGGWIHVLFCLTPGSAYPSQSPTSGASSSHCTHHWWLEAICLLYSPPECKSVRSQRDAYIFSVCHMLICSHI